MAKSCLCAALLLAACSGGGGSPDARGPDADPGVLAERACTDSLDSIYADPGALPADKGAILRCARDRDLSAAEIGTTLSAEGYQGPIASGAHVYRILYRTERGTATPTPGTSSAIVYLPDTPRAAALPLVVANHGSRGQAAACAPSRFAPEGEYVRADFELQMLTLVGAGFAVIAPDLGGYANYGAAGNPPSGYASTADSARSVLDGARALRNLIPSRLTNDIVLIGHSLGGHTALSALSLADSYGTAGTVVAVGVYSPLWLTQRTWGTIPAIASVVPFSSSPAPNAISLWYHYTASELMDGPGHGGDVFQPAVRATIKDLVDSRCWDQTTWDYLPTLGSDATAIFDPHFINAVSSVAGGFYADCTQAPDADPTLCQKWMDHYEADRPHLTGTAASVPILFAWGKQDATITNDRVTCAIDRLKADVGTNLTVCVDADADHSSIVATSADHMIRWLAARTLGEAEPAACALDETSIVDTDGNPILCNGLPPND